MQYNSFRLLVRLCIIGIATQNICQAARVYVKNWGSSEIIITNVVVPPTAGITIDPALKNSKLTIQPGQHEQIIITHQGVAYSNISQFTITYKLQEHRETETIYFPASPEQETSLYFTDSSYDRFPYNIGDK